MRYSYNHLCNISSRSKHSTLYIICFTFLIRYFVNHHEPRIVSYLYMQYVQECFYFTRNFYESSILICVILLEKGLLIDKDATASEKLEEIFLRKNCSSLLGLFCTLCCPWSDYQEGNVAKKFSKYTFDFTFFELDLKQNRRNEVFSFRKCMLTLPPYLLFHLTRILTSCETKKPQIIGRMGWWNPDKKLLIHIFHLTQKY